PRPCHHDRGAVEDLDDSFWNHAGGWSGYCCSRWLFARRLAPTGNAGRESPSCCTPSIRQRQGAGRTDDGVRGPFTLLDFIARRAHPARCQRVPFSPFVRTEEGENTVKQEAIMRTIVALLSAVFMLSVVTAAAQDKTKEGAHQGMAKASGAMSDAAVIAKATS